MLLSGDFFHSSIGIVIYIDAKVCEWCMNLKTSVGKHFTEPAWTPV